MIKAVVIDDEPKAIKNMLWELETFSDEVEVVKTFTNPEDAVVFLNEDVDVKVLFLDIEMPQMDGFTLLSRVPDRFNVIFTTAYSEYALRALKENALDYILKPFNEEDLRIAIDKVKSQEKKTGTNQQIESLLLKLNIGRKIPLNTEGKMIFINPDDIIYIVSDRNYCTVHCDEDKKIILSKTLREFEDILNPDKFFRAHNSYIINLQKVQEFHKTDSCLMLEGGVNIPVSRGRRMEFFDKI